MRMKDLPPRALVWQGVAGCPVHASPWLDHVMAPDTRVFPSFPGSCPLSSPFTHWTYITPYLPTMATMQAHATAVNTQLMTRSQSLAAVHTLLRAGLSCITFLR